jgi:hypothetical protein
MDGILLPVLQGSGLFPITSSQRVTTLTMRNQMGGAGPWTPYAIFA